MGEVQRIYIAPGRGVPMQSVVAATAVAGVGLLGDRYALAKHRRGEDYQVTLIEAEHIEAFRRDTGLDLTLDMPRRNVVVRGFDLNACVGKPFTVGSVVLEGLELCEPCRLWQKRTYREVLRYFIGKGGLRARIVSGGTIRVGDAVC